CCWKSSEDAHIGRHEALALQTRRVGEIGEERRRRRQSDATQWEANARRRTHARTRQASRIDEVHGVDTVSAAPFPEIADLHDCCESVEIGVLPDLVRCIEVRRIAGILELSDGEAAER